MRKQKTAKKNRINYVYFTAEDEEIRITPANVDASWIAILHDMDDDEFNANRRESYHVPVHYDACIDADGEDASDCNPYLMDIDGDPLEQILQDVDDEEHRTRLEKLKKALGGLKSDQKDLIIDKFYRGKSNVEIAAAEGVSETAIRKRLKVIYTILAKKI